MKSAILVRMSAIGDVIIALRAVRILKESGVEPLLITSPGMLPILRFSPFIKWAATHEKGEELKWFHKEEHGFVETLASEVGSQFSGFAQTHFVDLQVTSRSRRAYKALKQQFPSSRLPKKKVSKRSFFRFWIIFVSFLKGLFFKQSQNKRKAEIQSIHRLQEETLRKTFPEIKQTQFTTWCEIPSGDLPDVPHIELALCPGASGPLKRWPKEHFRKFKESYLKQNSQAMVGVIGGPDDTFAGDYIAYPKQENVSTYCGKLNIFSSILVLAKSKLKLLVV